MTKSNIIDAVAEKAGLKKKDAESAVNAVFSTLEEAFVAGEKVQIVGFGTFEVKERQGRNGVNPFTHEKMEIAASKHLTFSAGKPLKESINK